MSAHLYAEETYRDVSVGQFLSPTKKSEAKAIIQNFLDIFSDLPGMTSLEAILSSSRHRSRFPVDPTLCYLL